MDLIILSLITAYIFFRLSKNLGKIDEEEKQEIHKKLLERKKQIEEILERAQKSGATNSISNPELNNQEKIIGSKSTHNSNFSQLDDTNQENLNKIFSACNIGYDFFINGAKMAFEMIINSFAKDDLETLKMLLSDKIYQGFESAIKNRKEQNQKLNTNLISIDNAQIISALLVDNYASIVVKISSKQINYITDKDNNIIQGKKDEISEINDIWTFKKDITNSNPNWLVSATSS